MWVATAVALLAPSVVFADLRADVPMDFTYQPSAPDGGVRVWAVSTNNRLVSFERPSTGDFWQRVERDPAGTHPVMSGTGVAAASYVTTGDFTNEHVVFVGSDGKLWELELITNGSGTTATWRSSNPPKPLTGHISAFSIIVGASRRVYAAVTDTNGSLRVAYRVPPTGSWTWVSPLATGVATTRPITTTVDPGQTIASIFYTRASDSQLILARWNGVSWSTTAQGNPPGGGACASLDSTQGQLSATVYKLDVVCARDAASIATLYAREFDSASATTGSWITLPALPAGSTIEPYFHTVTAITRWVGAGGPERAIDAYVISQTNERVFRYTRTASASFALTNLGWPNDPNLSGGADAHEGGEVTDLRGGLIAVPEEDYVVSSRVLFVARVGATATYLYSRGDQFWPWWQALGTVPVGGAPIASVAGLNPGHAEAFLASRGGLVLAAAIRAVDWEIDAVWSTNDGQTWPASMTEIPRPTGLEASADPATVVTDSGRGYVVALGLHYDPPRCSGGEASDRRVYFTTTTDGTAFSTPVELTVATNTGADHPWVGVDRGMSPDRIHVVWKATTGGIRYRCIDDYATPVPCGSDSVQVSATHIGTPVLTVARDGGVFVAWAPIDDCSTCDCSDPLADCDPSLRSLRICRLNGSGTCEGSPFALRGNYRFPWADVSIGSMGEALAGDGGFAIAASRINANRVYYTWNARETTHSTRDVYAAYLTYNPNTKTFQVSSRWAVRPQGSEDGFQQLLPTLDVHFGSPVVPGVTGWEAIDVSFYNFGESGCADAGRCMRRKRAHSYYYEPSNAFAIFSTEQRSQGGTATDAMLLPRDCGGNVRFAGHYDESIGTSLHSLDVWSAAPVGSPADSASLSCGFLSSGGYFYDAP